MIQTLKIKKIKILKEKAKEIILFNLKIKVKILIILTRQLKQQEELNLKFQLIFGAQIHLKECLEKQLYVNKKKKTQKFLLQEDIGQNMNTFKKDLLENLLMAQKSNGKNQVKNNQSELKKLNLRKNLNFVCVY